MPDSENEWLFDTGLHHAAAIVQFEAQCAHPELNQAISETDQEPRPPSFDFQFGERSFVLFSSRQRYAREFGKPI